MNTPSDRQHRSRLNRLHQLLESDIFDKQRADSQIGERAFSEIIGLLDEVLQQSEEAGHRIDFIKEVGVHGKIQDITSLVNSLHRNFTPETVPVTGSAPSRFNCYYDAGTGYFANGFFFSADHNDEVAFFVDDQRIYLNRHIKRALQEAEQYLDGKATPSTTL